MAKKEGKEKKAEVKEKFYTIPLGKACSKHISKRSIRAVKMVREYLKKHTKKENVKLSPNLNEALCSRGMSKAPRSIKVKAVIELDKVSADLVE